MNHNTCISSHRFASHHHLRALRPWAWLCAAAVSLNSCVLLQAAQRPIADFTSRQGTFCLDASFACVGYGGSGCSLFVPPQPNVIGFIDPNTANFVLVDYSGSANSLKPLGTTVDGSITEVPLDDGRAEVVVVLHTRNALAWASDISSSFPGPTLFGHRLDEVLAGGDAALADSLLQVTFKNTSPGAPLPDIIQLVNCPDPGQELESISFRARANGTLRAAFGVADGSAGRLEVTQTGLLAIAGTANSNSRVALDAFPAEKIIIQPTGK